MYLLWKSEGEDSGSMECKWRDMEGDITNTQLGNQMRSVGEMDDAVEDTL